MQTTASDFPTSAFAARPRLGAIVVCIGVLLLLVQYAITLPVVPEVIEDAYEGATVFFAADDTRLYTGDDCTTIRWRVDGIQSVYVDNAPVVGEGSQQACNRTSKLTVTFLDGTARDYRLSKPGLLGDRIQRVLVVGAWWLVCAGVYLSGGFQRVTAAIGRRIQPAGGLTQRNTPGAWLLLVLLILLGMAARVAFLSQPLRYDEAWTYQDFVSQPLSVGLTHYYTTNNHLGNTLLAHITTSIWGGYPWVLRLPAFFAGILVIPAAYILARRMFNQPAAILAAALAAGSSHVIEYSVNARGYTLNALFLLLLFYAADRWLARPGLRWTAAIAVLTALGMYSVPTFAYGAAVVFAWLLLMVVTRYRGRALWAMLWRLAGCGVLSGVLTLLPYIPPLLYMANLPPDTMELAHLGELGMQRFLRVQMDAAARAWHLWNLDVPVWLTVILVVGLVLGTVKQLLVGRRLPLLLVAGLVVPAMLFVQANNSYPRLWMPFLPVYFVLASGGLVFLAQVLRVPPVSTRVVFRTAAALITVLLVVNLLDSQSVYYAGETGLTNDAEDALLVAKQNLRPDDMVICDGTCEPVRIYAAIHGVEIAPIQADLDLAGRSLLLIQSSLDGAQRPGEWSIDFMTRGPLDGYAVEILMQSGSADVYRVTPR